MKFFSLLFITFSVMQFNTTAQQGWFELISGTTNPLTSIYFANADTGFVVGFDGIILKTTDGGTNWLPQFNSYSQNLYAASFSNHNNGWAVGADGIILHTTDGGANWILQTSGTPNFLTGVDFINDSIGWAVGGLGTLLNTTNGGTTWMLSQLSYMWLESIFFIDQDYGWIVGQDGLIYNTTNGGLTWSAQISGINDYLYSVHFVDRNYGWAVGGWGVLIKTTDGGNNWINIQFPTNTFSRTVFFVNQNVGWIGGWRTITYDGCVLGSNDGGNTWAYQGINFDSMIRSLFFLDENLGWGAGNSGVIIKTIMGGVPVELTLFNASTFEGKVKLYWSTSSETNNNGFDIERNIDDTDWERIGFVEGEGTTTEPIEYSYVDDISSIKSNSIAYRLKQLDYNGSFEYSDIVYADNLNLIDFALHQNFPNPFNPTTSIKYQIPEISSVTLKVFDILGNEITTLINEEKPIGSYEVEFDASRLPSGVYFYRLQAVPIGRQAGSFVETKKMVLLR